MPAWSPSRSQSANGGAAANGRCSGGLSFHAVSGPLHRQRPEKEKLSEANLHDFGFHVNFQGCTLLEQLEQEVTGTYLEHSHTDNHTHTHTLTVPVALPHTHTHGDTDAPLYIRTFV